MWTKLEIANEATIGLIMLPTDDTSDSVKGVIRKYQWTKVVREIFNEIISVENDFSEDELDTLYEMVYNVVEQIVAITNEVR